MSFEFKLKTHRVLTLNKYFEYDTNVEAHSEMKR